MIGSLVTSLAPHIKLLAPDGAMLPPVFLAGRSDPSAYQNWLDAVRYLRGSIYLEDGAVSPQELDSDGRHVDPYDHEAWHVLVTDGAEVLGAVRIKHFGTNGQYHDFRQLELVERIEDASERNRYRRGIEGLLTTCIEEGVGAAECGAWFVTKAVRRQGHSVLVFAAGWALTQVLGHALTLCMATQRHGSAAFLRKAGVAGLQVDGECLPPVYDPHYDCHMELLVLNSRTPHPLIADAVEEIKSTYFPMIEVIKRR